MDNPVPAERFTVMWAEDGMYLCCPGNHVDGIVSGWIELASDSSVGELLDLIQKHNAEHHA